MADTCQSRYRYVCIYSNDFDEANKYENAIEDLYLVDLEAGVIRRLAYFYLLGFK